MTRLIINNDHLSLLIVSMKVSCESAYQLASEQNDNINQNSLSSKLVSDGHCQTTKRKSPSKPIPSVPSHESPKVNENESQPPQLDLHGIGILKNEPSLLPSEFMEHEPEPTYIANLIWDGTESNKSEYITPINSRSSTARYSNHKSSLRNPMLITPLNNTNKKQIFKNNDIDDGNDDDIGMMNSNPRYPFLPLPYLKMSTMEDCSKSHNKDGTQLCDYELYNNHPHHSTKITEMLKKKINPKTLFNAKIYPTKSFKEMNAVTTVSKNNKRQEIIIPVSYDKDNKDKIFIRGLSNYIDNTNNNNDDDNVDECAVFKTNQKEFLKSYNLPNTKLFPNTQVESSLIPYKKNILSMRKDCLSFRKKWSS